MKSLIFSFLCLFTANSWADEPFEDFGGTYRFKNCHYSGECEYGEIKVKCLQTINTLCSKGNILITSLSHTGEESQTTQVLEQVKFPQEKGLVVENAIPQLNQEYQAALASIKAEYPDSSLVYTYLPSKQKVQRIIEFIFDRNKKGKIYTNKVDTFHITHLSSLGFVFDAHEAQKKK